MIKIKNLEKFYSKLHVLKNIDLSIDQGKITYLVGPNGSGKSTLIKSILGLIKKYNGTISINGKIINEESEYRNLIGYMPQSASFPDNLTVKDIIKMVKEIRNKKIYDEELITKFVLSKEMNKKLKNLSGGTIQKVSAALAFLFDPKILILDEATSALDNLSEGLVQLALNELMKNRTSIIIAHRLSTILDADLIVVMEDGRIVESGTHNELIQHKDGAYFKLSKRLEKDSEKN